MKRRYHLGLPFFLYCGLTLLVALAAMNRGSNLLFWVFGVMASALLISGAVSGIMMVNLRVRRIVPAQGEVGQPLIVHYAVRNRGRLFPAFGLQIRERPVAGRDDGERLGWGRLMPPARAWIMHIGPRETVHGEAVFRPDRRGEARFKQLQIGTSFPFGIIGKSLLVTQTQRVLVYPRCYPLRRRVLDALAPVGTVGTRITSHAGAGDDYFGLREFRRGDSMRHVAWKRTANRDELVCIERTRPSPPKVRVVLNLTATGDGDDAREREEDAISLAGSILCAAAVAGFEIGLTVLGPGRPRTLPVRRGHFHRHRLMAALARIDLDAPRRRAGDDPQMEPGRTGMVVVHPERPDPTVVRGEAWHFSATQLEHFVERRWSVVVASDAAAVTVPTPVASRPADDEAAA